MGVFRKESLVERLTREIRWLVTEREGDYHRIRPDDGSALRYVNVRCRDDRAFMMLWTHFPVRFPISAVTPELTLGLLKRNREVWFGRWCIDVVGSCELALYLHHSALKAGLTAGTFRTICEEMINEREALHDALRDQLAGFHQINLPPGQLPISRGVPGRKLGSGPAGGPIVWLGD